MVASTVILNSGHHMPQVGHGLWKISKETCSDRVYDAIKAGYRLFDGACDYGNEVEVGHGVARAIKEGIVKREELFLVTKLWNTFHEKKRVEPACRRQLEDLGVDYVDLYIMHFPIGLQYVDPSVKYPPEWFSDGVSKITQSSATIRETWTAMEALVDLGLTRSIGISNFNCSSILDLLRYARIRPATLQIEHHPYLVQAPLIAYAQSEGLTVTAYSSFGPQGYVEMDLDHAVKAPHLFINPVIVEIAKKHGKGSPQVLLKWATQRGVAVIPKSDTLEMLTENLGDGVWELEKEDLEKISALNRGLRFNDPWVYFGCLPIFN